VKRKLALVAAVLAAYFAPVLLLAGPVDAHRAAHSPPRAHTSHWVISAGQAIDLVERVWSSRCGNDDASSTWICDGWKYVYAARVGYHSYNVEVHWSEVRIWLNGWPRWDVRGCGVQARVEHDWVAEVITPEWCWWQ
jgi:hypothetical protein